MNTLDVDIGMKSLQKFLFILVTFSTHFTFAQEIAWRNWSGDLFEEAKAEQKVILLNLKANWCHWCHVMHDSTYANPEVQDYIDEHFIPVAVDQDANPALSERYREYGWPATIFINGEKEDVVKRAGYISPDAFLRLLKAIVRDPSPEPYQKNRFAYGETESPVAIQTLQEKFIRTLDVEKGGFDQPQKYLEWESFEYAYFHSVDSLSTKWIRQSLEGAQKLEDPVWGGIYQYSTHYDWDHCHYEKLLKIQARYIKMFVLGYVRYKDTAMLRVAERIHEYCQRFLLQPNGLYGNAQDADLVKGVHSEAYFSLSNMERLKKGIPSVDTNTYTSSNAQYAQALLYLSIATNNQQTLDDALAITEKLKQREAENGLVRHTAFDDNTFTMADNLAYAELLMFMDRMGIGVNVKRGFSSMIQSIYEVFKTDNGTYKSFVGLGGLSSQFETLENIRVANLLLYAGHRFNSQVYHTNCDNLLQLFLSEAFITSSYSEPGVIGFASLNRSASYELLCFDAQNTNSPNLRFTLQLPKNVRIMKASPENPIEEKKELLQGFSENVFLMCTKTSCSPPFYKGNDVITYLSRELD